jgi:hypothetical protein
MYYQEEISLNELGNTRIQAYSPTAKQLVIALGEIQIFGIKRGKTKALNLDQLRRTTELVKWHEMVGCRVSRRKWSWPDLKY